MDGEAVIKANRFLMLRVIDNFFINALDNTPLEGNISIEILDGTLGAYNSGNHIPKDKIERIWLLFEKSDAALKLFYRHRLRLTLHIQFGIAWIYL